MEISNDKNILASTLVKQGNQKAYDKHCKKILSNKQIIAYFLKEYIEEFKDIPLQEIPKYLGEDDEECIENLNLVDESILGSSIEFDILFNVRMPKSNKYEIVNIEAQMEDNPRISIIEKSRILL